jgi:hypothetical protein
MVEPFAWSIGMAMELIANPLRLYLCNGLVEGINKGFYSIFCKLVQPSPSSLQLPSSRQHRCSCRPGDDGCGGGRWQRWTMTAADDDNGDGGRRRRRTTTAHEIRRRTTRGKEDSGRQTTTALDKRLISPPGREPEKINKSSSPKKTFFSDTVYPVGFFAPAETAKVPF